MLVLTRRIGEEVLIGGNIRLRVLAVKRNQVRLGIAAPPSVPVARLELLAECSEDEGGALQPLEQNTRAR
jgi:carbon storage regulator